MTNLHGNPNNKDQLLKLNSI